MKPKRQKTNIKPFIGIGLVATLIIGMVGYKLNVNSDTLSASDAAKIKHTVNVGVDDWAGYFYLCSPKTRAFAIEKGVLIKCEDDGVDFDKRFNGLKDGSLQLAAMTADTFTRQIDKHRSRFASVIAVIDESSGGDAILVNKSFATDTESFKAAKRISIGFTPESPSSMLVTSWVSDFGIDLSDTTKYSVVEANGSQDACGKLMRGEVEAAACWEPDVTKALDSGKFVKIMDSGETKNLIVDVLVGNNDFIRNNGNVLELVLQSYGQSMDYYAANPEDFDKDFGKYTGLSGKSLESLMNGITWPNIVDNGVNWLGVNYGGGMKGNIQLFDTFTIVTNLLLESGELDSNPFPNDDPFSMINSNPITNVFTIGEAGNIGYAFIVPTKVENLGISRKFKKASAARWMKMTEVGSVNIPKISFKSGKDEFYPASEDQEAFKKIVDILLKYPNYRLKIEGHTGCGTVDCKYDDKPASMDLSKARAVAVQKVLIDQIGIHKNRVMTVGYGSEKPITREMIDGKFESKRSWLKRWARVEVKLVR